MVRQAEIFYGNSSIPFEVLRHVSCTLDSAFQVDFNSNFLSMGGVARDNANDGYLPQLTACRKIHVFMALVQEWKRCKCIEIREALRCLRVKASTDP